MESLINIYIYKSISLFLIKFRAYVFIKTEIKMSALGIRKYILNDSNNNNKKQYKIFFIKWPGWVCGK